MMVELRDGICWGFAKEGICTMSLEQKTLPELIEVKVKLTRQIQRDPVHSGMERVELEDVKNYIELRTREARHRELVSAMECGNG
jgi:hypothetical protein